jgi:hypothetical protein
MHRSVLPGTRLPSPTEKMSHAGHFFGDSSRPLLSRWDRVARTQFDIERELPCAKGVITLAVSTDLWL